MKYAIIVVDVTKGSFRDASLKRRQKKLINNINELVDFGRQKQIPIIWIKETFKKDLSDAPLSYKKGLVGPVFIEGTEAVQFPNNLKIHSNDKVIVKKRYSAFFKTKLEEDLRDLNADVLIICGVNSHACIRATVVDAYERDYDVILALDCVDSYDKKHHLISIEYLSKVMSSGLHNYEIAKAIG